MCIEVFNLVEHYSTQNHCIFLIQEMLFNNIRPRLLKIDPKIRPTEEIIILRNTIYLNTRLVLNLSFLYEKTLNTYLILS